jgi:hypothetical protein
MLLLFAVIDVISDLNIFSFSFISFFVFQEKVDKYTIQQTKLRFVSHYATIQFQAIVRSYLDRSRLTKHLSEAKEEQLNEIRKWSIVLIQKLVRGFLARRTIIRSMKIRKGLSKELLQIAERFLFRSKETSSLLETEGKEGVYLPNAQEQKKKKEIRRQNADIWGFLAEVNQELLHYKREIIENEEIESSYAKKFVENVMRYRQNEFNSIWESFPSTLAQYTKKTKNDTMIGSLLPLKTINGMSSSQYSSSVMNDEQEQIRLRTDNNLVDISQTLTAHSLLLNEGLEENETEDQSLEIGNSSSYVFLSPQQSLVSTALKQQMSVSKSLPSLSFPSSPSSALPMLKQQKSNKGPSSHLSPLKKNGKGISSSKSKQITIQDVSLAMTKNSEESLASQLLTKNQPQSSSSSSSIKHLTGPLIRKALQTTVQQEVTEQLNQLMNHSFHSRKLTNDIISAYQKDSVYVKGEITQKLLSGRGKKATKGRKSARSPKRKADGEVQLAPLNRDEIRREIKRNERKKVSLDGKVIEHKGKMEASHFDWINQAASGNTTSPSSLKKQVLSSFPSSSSSSTLSPSRRNITAEIMQSSEEISANKQPTVYSGSALLLDIPNGLNDSIERFIHAAALRCYVPDFFRGPQYEKQQLSSGSEDDGEALPSSASPSGRRKKSNKYDEEQGEEASEKTVDEKDEVINEGDSDEIISRKHLSRQRRQQSYNPNHDPNYAYSIYLQLPMSLVKVRYEQECQKWSQGVINKLRVKGLNYLPDVAPMSKFIVCLRSVEAPKVLISKCVDVWIDLKSIDSLTKGTKLPLLKEDKLTKKEQQEKHEKEKKEAEMLASPLGKLSKLKEQSSKEETTATAASDNKERSSAAEQIDGETGENHEDSLVEGKSLTRKVSFDESAFLKEYDNDNDNGFHDSQQLADNPFVSSLMSSSSSSIRSHKPPASANAPFLENTHLFEGLSPHDMTLMEKASKLLQEMLESTETAEWCNLNANIEELFIQAAFLIVPHLSKRFPNYNLVIEKQQHEKRREREEREMNEEVEGGEEEEIQKKKEEENLMGNYAFKLYTMELLQIMNENEKVDFVKSRFRASVIFTSPFTLYLKSKGIMTIKQLLSIDLKDLSLPSPLFIQLEILLNIIISTKIVKANLLTVPRDHFNLTKDNYYIPMFYDKKFQRTPLDPYGRSIGLGITQIKQKLKRKDLKEEERNKRRADELNPVIEDDLEKEISIWKKNEKADSTGSSNVNKQQKEEDEEQQYDIHGKKKKKHHIDENNNDQRLRNSPMKDLKAEANHQFEFMMNQLDDHQLHEIQSFFPNDGNELQQDSQVFHSHSLTSSNDLNVQKKQASPLKKASQIKVKKVVREVSTPTSHPLVDRVLQERGVFPHSYVCEHPHCGQIFSRLYTYKVHLRTHENFPEYFEYKRNPQLFYDQVN